MSSYKSSLVKVGGSVNGSATNVVVSNTEAPTEATTAAAADDGGSEEAECFFHISGPSAGSGEGRAGDP